ncbi:hypothetical protein H6M51_10940 [Rhizobium sp. AQ_MP]|uniref:hypothetical protein n=1 Tax=Rhizobium sp. AQ_MP TaxID=2761536 RepID=UPI00163AD07E|nr:hypothetical protein [Rhizobium sp. AQ_MP]MBC2773383.1 hypothetical protein [Rhizobium sp. AQ_MP]
MFRNPLQILQLTCATLVEASRRRAMRAAACRTLAPLGPALRDDLGLTHHRQYINFQNDKHQKHSFE